MLAMREEVDRVFHRANNDSIIVAENGSSSKEEGKEGKSTNSCELEKLQAASRSAIFKAIKPA